MTGNLTQAVAIPSFMGGSAYKGSVRSNRQGYTRLTLKISGEQTPNAFTRQFCPAAGS